MDWVLHSRAPLAVHFGCCDLQVNSSNLMAKEHDLWVCSRKAIGIYQVGDSSTCVDH
uniref:Uncharacterized protein n=1 Tax=Arundo donax TaxID=35708 RepID=A0A0A9DKJ7_ARUDO